VSKKPESRLQKRIREALEKEFGGIGNGMLDAMNRGLRFYKSRKSCCHGHPPIRYTATNKCVECRRRSPSKKANRRISDQRRRDLGTLTGWSHERRCATPRGHKGRMLAAARSRAKRKNLPFTIDIGDFDIPTHCPVLGIKLGFREGKSGPCNSSPTLDRIHNHLGYIRGNVEVISWRANHLKSNGTLDELRKMVKYYGKAARKSIAEKDKGGT
jgi:hypothetical protein